MNELIDGIAEEAAKRAVIEQKLRELDAYERALRGLPPNLTRRERRALERANKKKRP